MEYKRGAKLPPVLLALVTVLCACLAICVLNSGTTAYAQPKIDGWCHVVWRGDGIEDDMFYVTMPNGDVREGHCIDPGFPAACEGDYPFSGTWNGSSFEIEVDATGGSPAPTQVDVGRGCQRVGRFTWTPVGKLELSKASSLPAISDNNACYSLAQAEYGVFQDAGCTIRINTLTTDETGYAISENLTIGTYYVKEIAAPHGYALDTTVYPVDVKMDETTRIGSTDICDTPQSARVSLLLQKIDAETGSSNTIGGCTLGGAVFSVKYYAGMFANADDAIASDNPARSWTLTTSNDGTLSLSKDALVSGDEFYTNSAGEPCLPLGSIVFEEIEAPEGYLLDSTRILVSLRSSGSEESSVAYTAPVMANQPIRGDLEFTKAQEDTQHRLAGIPFKITSLTTGESHIIVTDENGYASSASSFNPHTTRTNVNDALYEQMCAEETEAEEAASHSTDESHATDNDTSAGATENLVDDSSREQIQADSCTSGKASASSNRIYHASEDDASLFAGESENNAAYPEAANASTVDSSDIGGTSAGLVSASPSPTAGSAGQNGASSNTSTNRTTLDLRSGIWFSGSTEITSTPSNTLGALPYDRYSIMELPCTANSGLELITQPCVTVSRDGYTIKLGTFDNQIIPNEPESPEPTPEPTPTPEATPTPSPTETPTPTATPAPEPEATSAPEQPHVQTEEGKTGVDLGKFLGCIAILALVGCGLITYGLLRCKKRTKH